MIPKNISNVIDCIEKYLQAARALLCARALNAQHPEVHLRLVHFIKAGELYLVALLPANPFLGSTLATRICTYRDRIGLTRNPFEINAGRHQFRGIQFSIFAATVDFGFCHSRMCQGVQTSRRADGGSGVALVCHIDT